MSFLGSETWLLRYQRNNKQSGLKNIRCFPECSKPHRLRGFCGNSITFQHGQALSPSSVSFGEFALKESVTMRVGDIVTPAEVAVKERTDDLFKPWFRGEPQDDQTIIFNKQKKGWHYSWVSNKHTSSSEHVFRVYLLDPVGNGSLRCTATHDSPAFTIFCRRRDKSGVDRLPPQFACQVKTSSSEGDEEEDEDEDDEDEEYDEDERPKRKRGAPVARSSKPSNPQAQKRSKPAVQAAVARSSSSSSSHQIMTPASESCGSSVPYHSSRPAPFAQALDRTSAENAPVFRILAALTNVHDRQVDGAANASGAGGSSSAAAATVKGISTPNTPSTLDASDDPDLDLFDISKAISDCWDWVSPPENLNDTQFFDSFFAQPSAKPVEDMLLRLGQHLLKEDFSKEIEEVFANKTGGTESKKLVISCLKEKFEKFFQREGTSLERFDRDLLAQQPQLAVEKVTPIQLLFPTSNSISFRNPMPIENMFRPPFRIVAGGIHDFTGHWRRPASTLEILEKIRSIIGFSWIERKLMLQMESEFFIWYEGNTMFVRGQRKLAGSNCLIHVIDGIDYPFVQPSAMISDNTPALGLFNRTWATEDGMMHFCTTYTVQFRTIRSTKRSACGNRLESTMTLQKNELNHLPGVWTDVFSFPTHAERVVSFQMVGNGE